MTPPNETEHADIEPCPSCLSTLVRRLTAVPEKVWLVCGRCGLSWSITERRFRRTAYDGPEEDAR
jgi:ribosomal protein L37AE/L43A